MSKKTFKFKSAKGSEFSIDYTPNGMKVTDDKAFEKHMHKVADLLECEGKLAKKHEDKPEPKKIEKKAEPKKDDTPKDLFEGVK